MPANPSALRPVVPQNDQKPINLESLALIIAATTFIVFAVASLIVLGGRELPIAGRGSLGELTAILSAISATVTFALSQLLRKYSGSPSATKFGTSRFHWFDFVALSLAHGAIALIAWIGLATIMEHSFQGATVYASPASLLAAAAAALSAYIAFLSGITLSPRQLSLVLAVFLAVGMVTAMLSSTDPLWWQMNLSALGITHDISSLTFNVTLIVSGVLVTTIARIGTAGLPTSTSTLRKRQIAVRILFVMLGVFLACVGCFPVDRFFAIHNTVATGMTVVFALLVLGLPWLIPSMPKTFVILGFIFVGVIIALVVLFIIGTYNLTAVELVSALLIFSWIILFLRNVETIAPAEAHS